jgi:ABC-type Zn uptake system ZnuABC Zn-binding protein ZnuA
MLRYNHLKGIKSKKHNISTGTLVLSYLLKYCHLKSLSIYGMDFKRTPTFYDISSHEENMKNTRIDHLCRHNYGNEEKYSLHMISKRKNVKIRGMLEDERMV